MSMTLCRFRQGNASGFRPGFRRDVFDLPIGHMGQAAQDVVQVAISFHPSEPAAFDDGYNRSHSVGRPRHRRKQLIFLADRGWPNRILDELIVDFDGAVLQIHGKRRPLA